MASKYKKININDLKEHLVSSFFKEWKDKEQLVGLELEVIPFRTGSTGLPHVVPLFSSGRACTSWCESDHDLGWSGLLEILRSFEGQCDGMRFEPSDDKTPRFVFNSGAQLTFEPGGQLEYSSAAGADIQQVTSQLFRTLDRLEQLLSPHEIIFLYGALNPWYRTEEVGLQIKKDRYLVMDRYFARLSPYGQKMMRLTASFQVNLDVGDRETAQRRWLAANLLSPVFLAVFGNSPFHQAKPTGYKSYRALIWEKLDPSRTGFQDGLIKEEYEKCPGKQYLDFALSAYCMLPGELGRREPLMRFSEWMEHGFNGMYPDLSDWEDHLTTLFPEVRPRGFLEMRYMDTLPKAFYSVPGTLLRRLMYEDSLLDKVVSELGPLRPHLRELVMQSAQSGLEVDVLREKAIVFFEELFSLPPNQDENLLEIARLFYEKYTRRGLSPADELLHLNDGHCPSLQQFKQLARYRLQLVEEPLDKLLASTTPIDSEAD
ncbi:MAG: hypothetical protein CR997_07575 [Acidobacteria bacterium]|nr:MAG: hypothetical protein CR997_07575 [Acidobacteriota bacterium]